MINQATAGKPYQAIITPLDSPRNLTRGPLVLWTTAAAIPHHSCQSGRIVKPKPTKNPIAKAQTPTDSGLIKLSIVKKIVALPRTTYNSSVRPRNDRQIAQRYF